MSDPVQRPIRTVAVPSDRAWFDGRLITGSLKVVTTDVAFAANTVTRIAKLSSNRVYLAFTTGSALLPNCNIAPWNDPQTWPWTAMQQLVTVEFRLFNQMALVTGEWYLQCGGAGTIRVVEQLRY